MLNVQFKSIIELLNAFPDEQSCIDHLEQVRWAGNVISPFDQDSKVYKCKDNKYRKYRCKNTGKYFNVRTGTLFQGTRLSLRKWFVAIYLLTTHKGITSTQLIKDVGMTQRAAWHNLHKIRNCFKDLHFPELEGKIETDETFYGGLNKNRHKDKKVKQSQGRSFKDKTPVLGIYEREKAVLVERDHKIIDGKKVIEKIITKPGRVIFRVVKDTKAKTIQPVIEKYVKKGSLLMTDEWHGYKGCNKTYNHQWIDHGKKQYVDYDNPDIHTNTIEGSWKIFKNCVRDTYNHVSPKHLQKYADEVGFRLNFRHLSVMEIFNKMLSHMENILTYKQLAYG